jgi:predicted Zn finger-like uncharacterized protein
MMSTGHNWSPRDGIPVVMVSDPLTDEQLESIHRPQPIVPMLIVCPNCTTSYEIDVGKLGPARSVRCARCRNTWQAVPQEPAVLAITEAHSSLAVLAALGGSVREAEAASSRFEAYADERYATRDATHPGLADPVGSAVTIDAPSLVPAEPALHDTNEPETIEQEIGATSRNGDIETAARRPAVVRPSRRRSRPRVNLPFVILALLTVVAALVGWRHAIVRAAPQTAGLYAAIGLPVNLRGLAIEDVKTTEEMQDNVPVLVVEGTVVNVVNRTVDVPRLRFAVRNPAGIEIYAWTALPNQPLLAPGERLAFRSRLASPPADTQDIVVRFFQRRDLEISR